MAARLIIENNYSYNENNCTIFPSMIHRINSDNK